MANKQQLQSAGDGTAIPAGYVGELIGTAQAGTGGSSYHTTTSTVAAINGGTNKVISQTVNKGIYLVTASIGQQKSATTNNSILLVRGTIGGTKVFPGTLSPQLATTSNINVGYVNIACSFPVNITADNTEIAIYAGWSANETAGTDCFNVLSIVRIA